MAASVPWPVTRGLRRKLNRHRHYARDAGGHLVAAKGRAAYFDSHHAVAVTGHTWSSSVSRRLPAIFAEGAW